MMKRWMKWMLLMSLSLYCLYGYADDGREIKILRQTMSDLDRGISDHLCMSYEIMHPYHRCKEIYVEQGTLTKPALKEFDFIIASEQYFNESLAKDFRLVLPLYQQAFTVVARGVTEDKAFNTNNNYGALALPSQKNVLSDILRAMGLNQRSLALEYDSSDVLIDRFCSFDINVAFITGAHPSSIVRQLNTLCGGEPLSIVKGLPKDFFRRHRYFYRMSIPKSYYWRLDKDIETLGIRYLLAVNKRADTEDLAALMASFVQELEYNHRLPLNKTSILMNYHNLQTPLHSVGEALMRQLEKAESGEAESETPYEEFFGESMLMGV